MTQGWAEDLHARVAAAIRHARGGRSAQWLADETERLGYPISRAAIANYESGRKKGLDIAELVVLAVALRVPPVALIYPDLPEGAIEVLPGERTTSWGAASWFSGERLAPTESMDGETGEATREFELIQAVRERFRQESSVAELFDLVGQFAGGDLLGQRTVRPSDPPMRALKDQLESASRELKRLEAVIRERGGVMGAE